GEEPSRVNGLKTGRTAVRGRGRDIEMTSATGVDKEIEPHPLRVAKNHRDYDYATLPIFW
ncbi:MAG: hypothetical protein OSA97_19495, partial [Nevskia sp.]|nr:hypothetical protein [Nevskia sp.]